jgi:hypothetical protein
MSATAFQRLRREAKEAQDLIELKAKAKKVKAKKAKSEEVQPEADIIVAPEIVAPEIAAPEIKTKPKSKKEVK